MRRFGEKQQQQQQQQQQQGRTGLALGAILENTELNNGHMAARKRSQVEAMSRNDREFLGKRVFSLSCLLILILIIW